NLQKPTSSHPTAAGKLQWLLFYFTLQRSIHLPLLHQTGCTKLLSSTRCTCSRLLPAPHCLGKRACSSMKRHCRQNRARRSRPSPEHGCHVPADSGRDIALDIRSPALTVDPSCVIFLRPAPGFCCYLPSPRAG